MVAPGVVLVLTLNGKADSPLKNIYSLFDHGKAASGETPCDVHEGTQPGHVLVLMGCGATSTLAALKL